MQPSPCVNVVVNVTQKQMKWQEATFCDGGSHKSVCVLERARMP